MDGEIFAVDERLQTVVLKQGVPRSMNHTLSVINMAAVDGVLEAQPCSPSVKTEDLPVVDLDRSRGRESRAVAQAQQDALKIGEGVSRCGGAGRRSRLASAAAGRAAWLRPPKTASRTIATPHPCCREAQAVFDAICKTLPCRWDQTSIVVLDEVRPDLGAGADDWKFGGL